MAVRSTPTSMVWLPLRPLLLVRAAATAGTVPTTSAARASARAALHQARSEAQNILAATVAMRHTASGREIPAAAAAARQDPRGLGKTAVSLAAARATAARAAAAPMEVLHLRAP